MAATDTNNSWEKIRQGVKDSETLIGQKKYNLSMVKSRQTLEYMVRCLCEKAAIVESDLATSIDELYNGRYISKTTCEHYHKIRMLGNKAVHEGSENAYDANQAYHLLSQEVYTFANDYNTRKRRPAPAQSQSGSRNSSKQVSKSSRSRKKAQQGGFPLSSTDLIRLGVVALCVVFVIVLVQFLKPKKDKPEESTPAATVEETIPETTPAPETMAETTPAAVYKTSDNLNVRSEPSTSGNKLGLIPAGTVVDYIEAYDDEWAKINYNGSEAYVASRYLVHD